MCNNFKMAASRGEVAKLIVALRDLGSNEPTQANIFPDYQAPIVRLDKGERILANARWGLPSPAFALKGSNRDPGVTNVRNTASSHWKRWLKPENRCLVPFTAFAEPAKTPERKTTSAWFELADGQAIAFFAGVWVPQWKSVRKVKEGETINDLFAFLTCEPNAEVGAIHPKAMPVILTDKADWQKWLTADWPEASTLQRPLPDRSLK